MSKPITYHDLRRIDRNKPIGVGFDPGSGVPNFTMEGEIFHIIADQCEVMEKENIELKAKLYDLLIRED